MAQDKSWADGWKVEALEQLQERLLLCAESLHLCPECDVYKQGKCDGLLKGIVEPTLELVGSLLFDIKDAKGEL